jgi:branched-chain amino acid transport system permease protein
MIKTQFAVILELLEMISYLMKNRALIVTLAIILLIFMVITQGLETKVWMSILLSGITLASLYFLIASGLSLIFGLMDVLNFAHGGIFVLGAYVGLSAFANPRLLFNTVPIFLAITAGALLARYYGVYLWDRLRTTASKRIFWGLMIILGVGIIVFSLRRFPIGALNAFGVTAVGGAVSTQQAQEPLSLMIQRLSLLILGGIPFGILMASRDRQEAATRRSLLHVVVITVVLLALAFSILFSRDVGEQFMLGLSVDMRFLIALVLGTLVGGLAGAGIEVLFIRPFYGHPVTQLVLTLGLSIALTDVIEGVWGDEGHPPMQPPSFFSQSCRSDSILTWFAEKCGSIDVFGRAFPTYRLFIIVLGVIVFVGIGLLLMRSRIGMIIRAGVQDSEMVQALGINVRQVFTFVFALGSALAALGGVVAAPFLGVYPAMGSQFMLQAFIAVVIGGMGSYPGAAVGTIILGLARAFGDHFVAAGIQLPFQEMVIKGSPAIAKASTVLIMAIILLIRPAGIFGKKE